MRHVYRPPVAYRAPQLFHRPPTELYQLRWLYNRATESYVLAPAGPYDALSVWDAETEAGNITVFEALWSDGVANTIGSDGIPYRATPSGRVDFDYREWDVATRDWVPVTGGDGVTATYYVGNAVPVLGTIAAQTWVAGVDSAYDLPLSDADDALDTLVITGTIAGTPITGTYNVRGVRTQLHTYLAGQPGEYRRWRLEFSLAHGAGNASGAISDLRVTDPLGAYTQFASFAWTRTDGVQVPYLRGLTYAAALDVLVSVGLSGTQPVLGYDVAISPGSVISTDPAYPAYVDDGSLISLIVCAVSVPSVVGQLEAAARATIEGLGYTVQTVSAYSSIYAIGVVSAQYPIGPATQDTIIVLTLSLGDVPVVQPARSYWSAKRKRYEQVV
jgi:beta-lactam-binding protein with PASTA domain